MWAVVDLKSTCLYKDVDAGVEFNHLRKWLRLGVEQERQPLAVQGSTGAQIQGTADSKQSLSQQN